MELVNNLPVILAAAFTIIAGLYGYLNGLPNARVYQNMCVFLVVFYLIGVLIRNTVKGIYEERADKADNEPVTEQLLYEGLSLGGSDASETDEGAPAADTEQADSEPDDASVYEDHAGDGDGAPPEYDGDGTDRDEAESAEFEENGGVA